MTTVALKIQKLYYNIVNREIVLTNYILIVTRGRSINNRISRFDRFGEM